MLRGISMSERRIRLLLIALVALTSFASAGIMIYTTRWGPAVYSDGVVYLLSADSLSRGGALGIVWGSGTQRYMSGFAPLYSLLVAGLETLGLSMLTAARVLSVACMSGLVLILGLLGHRVTRSAGVGLALSLFAATSPQLLVQIAAAGSEGVFYVTGMAGLLLTLVAEESGKRAHLVLSAILLGLALLSRYVGLSIVVAAALYVLLLAGRPTRERILRAGVTAGLPLAMSLPWLAWTRHVSGSAGGKSLHAIGNIWEQTQGFRVTVVDTMWRWLPLTDAVEASYRTRLGLLSAGVVVLLVILAGAAAIARRPGRDPGLRPLIRMTSIYLLWGMVYLAVHAGSYLAISPKPDINDRLLTPVYIAAVVAVLGAAWLAWRAIPFKSIRVVLALLLVGVIVIPNAGALRREAESLHQQGGGFTSPYWRQSQTVDAVRGLPEGTPIISHAADALIFLTGRPTYWIPELMQGQAQDGLARFGDHPESSEEEYAFRYRGGALVVFPWIEEDFRDLYGGAAGDRADALTNGLEVYWSPGENEGVFFYPAAD